MTERKISAHEVCRELCAGFEGSRLELFDSDLYSLPEDQWPEVNMTDMDGDTCFNVFVEGGQRFYVTVRGVL